jgi:hypothetical protein
MRLQDKFKRVFIFPLIFGILISIILTVVILSMYSQYFSDTNLTQRLEKVELGKSNPLLYTANNLIFKKFQKNIYALFVLKEYYNFYAKSVKNGNTTFDSRVIDSHISNSLKINDNYAEFINNLERESENNSTYLDHAFWHYDNKISDYSKLSQNLRYQLMSLTNMIPILRSLYEATENNLFNRLDLIYFANKNTNLFFGYPIFNDNANFFNMFKSIVNPPSCKTETGIQPDYYDFQCRDWWEQVIESTLVKNSQDIVITHPYKFGGFDKFGITVCIKLDDIFVEDYQIDKEEALSTICVDIDISDLYEIFDNFNKELSGYFYVLRVNSDIPIYYPMIMQNSYFSSIARFEFDIGTPYFVEELSEFIKNIVPGLISKYDENVMIDYYDGRTLIPVSSGVYSKNGVSSNYTIYPIKLYTKNDQLGDSFHILTIVYVNQPTILKVSIQNFQVTLYPRLVIQIFLFAIMGAILVLIAWSLIIAIATNIVKPIKNLKYMIQGMNVGSNSSDSEVKNQQPQQWSSQRRKMREDSLTDFYDINEESRKNEGSTSEQLEYDEETLQMRSAEMDKLFNILLKLKNVLTFTTNSKTIFDKNALVNYVNAKYTFSEVSNLKGKNVCDSNVGNLALRCHKYDKAVLHFIESLPEEKKYLVPSSSGKLTSDVLSKKIIDLLNTLKSTLHVPGKLSKMKNKNSVNTLNLGSSQKLNEIPMTNNNINQNQIDSSNSLISSFTGVNLLNKEKDKFSSTPNIRYKQSLNNYGSIKDLNSSIHSIFNKKNENLKRDQNLIVLLESRYPKLLYAYKKLFKMFRKIMKNIHEENHQYGMMNKDLENKLNFNYTGNPIHSAEKFQQKILEEFMKLDLFVVNERHSLEAYEYYLMDYIKESASIGDHRRTAEALLEYIEFLITYKLKHDSETEMDMNLNEILNFGKLNPDNKSIKENQTSNNHSNQRDSNLNSNDTPNQIHMNKLETLEQIGKYFNYFDILYETLRQGCSSEYFKTFLDLLRNNRKESLDTIESPFLVLFQRSNYLKGKLSKICGHMDKALEFFHRSRETLIICDASLIKKSIRQIIKIMEFLKDEVDKEVEIHMETGGKYINLLENSNKDSKDFSSALSISKLNFSGTMNNRQNTIRETVITPEKKLKEKIENLKEKSREIETYIKNNLEQLGNFTCIPKDFVVLIDISHKMRGTDSKKIEKALRTANNFFDLYITTEDRFGLFVYANSLNPIISLTQKNYNTYIYVKNMIDGMINDYESKTNNNNQSNIDGFDKMNMSCTCKAISSVYDYLRKKNPDESDKLKRH